MKALRLLGAVAFLAGLAAAAWAGDCGGCGGGCCGSKDSGAFNCQNQCPLAQKANERRSFGCEGDPAKDCLAKQVQKNLAKV